MEPTTLIDRVRQDHALIYRELALLKRAENDNTVDLWKTLRDICARLSAGLLEHMQQEGRMNVPPLNDHLNDYRYLQVIARSIAVENSPFLLNNRFKLLTGFLQGLHRHMDEQEVEFVSVAASL